MLVSVVMPMHNESDYIEESINSILNQTYENFEFIIVDDCSTDDSLNKVKNIKDKRINLIELSKNMGVSHAVNIGIKNSRGDYIVRMDADDISTRDRIEKLIAFAQKQDVDLIGSQFDVFSDSNIPDGLYRFMDYSNKIVEQKEIIDNFTVMIPVSQPTFCIRKDIFKEEFWYNTNLLTAEDYEFLGRLLINNKKVCKVPEKLVHYRYVNSSLSNSRKIETTINGIKIKLDFIFKYYSLKRKGKKNVYIWGTKEFAGYLYDELKKTQYDICIKAFTDFNSQKWGKSIKGLSVISPTEMIKKLNKDDFIITIWNLEREAIMKFLDDNELQKNLDYFVFS